MVTVPQAPQRNFGNSQCTFSSRTGGISHTCPHPRPAGSAPASPAPHDRHSAGGSAFSARSGSRAGSSPAPWWPGCPPGLRLGDRSRSDARRAALWRALAASGSFDGGEEELLLSIPRRRSSSATRNSSRRITSAWRACPASSAARSAAISVSLASTTARSQALAARSAATSSRRADGSSGTSHH